ncbi:MAG: hypothetical protein ABEJ31_00210 [Haloarculaceae archaeon]
MSGRELGHLCPACEAAEFGRSLERGAHADDSCLLCERDGFYALPVWRATVEIVDGRRVARSEYSLEEPCPKLCDVHFEAVAAEPSPDRADAVASGRR